MRFLVTYVCLLMTYPLLGQGQYIERIPVPNSNGETYAIYIPEGYNVQKKGAVLFSFAPDGIGRNGIRPFKSEADSRQMIVVSSNDSKNGPYDLNLRIAQRLFNTVLSKYAIDDKQIYLAGFSGGSRLATAIASLSSNIAGVIGCGAAFSNVSDHLPKDQPYTWVGIIGDADFNYQEMLAAKNYLTGLNFTHALQIFSGSHQWPPEEEVAAAFRFMDLERHKNGEDMLSRKRIENHFNEDCHRLSQFYEKNDLIKTAFTYSQMINGYEQVRMVDSLRVEHNNLITSDAYMKQYAQTEKALNTELAIKRRLELRFHSDYREPNRANWKAWKKEIKALKEPSDIPAITQMHKRLLFYVYILGYSSQNPNVTKTTTSQQAFCKQLRQLL